MPSFIARLRAKWRRYIPAIRAAQLFAARDSPGICRSRSCENRFATPFCMVSPGKNAFAAGFFAIPFDFRLRPTLESAAFRRHRGFELMKAGRKRAKAAASKGAAKKAPKRKKKATTRRKAKKK
ncbi:MAG TPA: hypothetical protein VLX85_03345 [Stellaceae bacterium]|nr:hypothetical protein [Stellaceae bacterium]